MRDKRQSPHFQSHSCFCFGGPCHPTKGHFGTSESAPKVWRMSDRRLRFSERKRLAETGNLGPLAEDEVPETLRRALRAYVSRNYFSLQGWQQQAAEHFGWLSGRSAADRFSDAPLDDVADLIEMYVEHASAFSGYRARVQSELNALFDRHRWAYRLEDGQLVRIGSPLLSDEIVSPALLAIQRSGWEQVERSYREALQHQRGGVAENDDALTAAGAALEAALKAAGLKGNTLGDLASAFRGSALVPGQVSGVPESLDRLIKVAAALRNTMGDAHGKADGAPAVPQPIVDLTIHLTGAFIVYLSRTVPA